MLPPPTDSSMLPPLPPVAAPVDRLTDPLDDADEAPLANHSDPLAPEAALNNDTSPLGGLALPAPPLVTLMDPPVNSPSPPTRSIEPPASAAVPTLRPAVIATLPPTPTDPSPTLTNTDPPLPPVLAPLLSSRLPEDPVLALPLLKLNTPDRPAVPPEAVPSEIEPLVL
ncbi:hypothetical protein PC121_g25525, partial [Phytophthora cactorum]